MALVMCAECGRQVSDMASFCPSCGNPDVRPQANDECTDVVPEEVAQAASSMPPSPDVPSENSATGEYAGLQFRQAKNERNKPRSIWPKLLVIGFLLAAGYWFYQASPGLLIKAGKPSHGQIEQLLKNSLTGSLSVNGYKVPEKFVDIPEVNVRSVEKLGRRDGVALYRVSGDAVARLTASGREIGRDVEGQIGRNAQRLDFRSAVDAVYSRARIHSAMNNVSAGTRYPLRFEAIVRKVDGNVVLVNGSVSSDN